MSIINKVLGVFLGNKYERDIKEIQPYVGKINEEYDKITSLSNDELRALSAELKDKVRSYVANDITTSSDLKAKAEDPDTNVAEKEDIYKQIDTLKETINEKIEEVLEEILPVAFAIVKDTARRFTENKEIVVAANDFDRDMSIHDFVDIDGDKATYYNKWTAGGNEVVWEMVHYDVQLIGGVALHKGKIAEMATGEGKTLVATLPVFLNALAGRGVHIITVNDYLARRDSEWMGPLYQFHGLNVDCIDKHEPNSDERRKAYNADITFGTNNEFGFDYLRDNMATNAEHLVQRDHHYAIVDEVDSVLIDDARTPLIISGPVGKGNDHELFHEYKPTVEVLFNTQRKLVTQLLSDAKKLISKGEKEKGGDLLLRAHKGLPKNKAIIKYLSEQGNKVLLQKRENFYMQENSKQMHIITDELYFIIDEKNNSIELTDKGIDQLSAASEDPNFFILPDVGSEIADIDKSDISEKEKLEKKDIMIRDYSVKTERVHTVNQLLKSYTMFEKDTEYVIADNKIKIVDEQTGRIMEGRRYSDGLHQAIEAKENVKVEASTQTFATITLQNFFRMYHKLAGMTGTAETEAGELWDIYKLDVVVIPTNRDIVRNDKEDGLYKTKREKYNAVIDGIADLVKQNRPVLVGTTSVEISELLSRMLKMKQIKHNVLNAKLHQREADVVLDAGKPGNVTIATNMAGRGTDIKLSKEVKDSGGLAIIGTERHESRRVDRQLRGRAGRQGDPGSSQFYLSLEDDLMRLFGSDRIAKLMDRMGLDEGDVIENSMITNSIERAQKKVEENNFGIRKRLLEYDDVMNSQREVIYKKRKHALYGERLSVDISNMIFDICENIIEENIDSTFDDVKLEAFRQLSIETPFDEEKFESGNKKELTKQLFDVAYDAYKRKSEQMATTTAPVFKARHEELAHKITDIIVPISEDNKRIYNVAVNLKAAAESKGKELISAFEKTAILATIDELWKEHLRELDELRQSVQNASYEQKDPLLIYKFESFELFRTMVQNINRDIVSLLMKGNIYIPEADKVQEAQTKRRDYSRMQTSRSGVDQDGKNEAKKAQPVRVEKKVGRNEPCPCGSGKKFKNCHGRASQ